MLLNLKKLRTEMGISQQALADKFNLSQQSIHKYECGLAEPDIRMLKDFAKYFNVSIDYLVNSEEENPPSEKLHFSTVEIEMVKKLRTLSPQLRFSLQMIIEHLADSNQDSFQE